MTSDDISATAESFWQQGYLLLEDFFPPAQMDACQAAISTHYGATPDFAHNEEFLGRAETEVIPWFPHQDGCEEFAALEREPRLEALTTAILGADWNALYCMVMFSPPASKGQAWHQDCAPENPSAFNLNRLVYTTAIGTGGGGEVVVVPGSHRRGVIPAGEPAGDLAGQQALAPRKGTLVLLHGHTWHRVLPVTGASRVSTNCRCSPAGTPADITDICVYRNMRYSFSASRIVATRDGTAGS